MLRLGLLSHCDSKLCCPLLKQLYIAGFKCSLKTLREIQSAFLCGPDVVGLR